MKKSYKILLVIVVILLVLLATGLKFKWVAYNNSYPVGYKGAKFDEGRCTNYGLYYPYLISKGIILKSDCIE